MTTPRDALLTFAEKLDGMGGAPLPANVYAAKARAEASNYPETEHSVVMHTVDEPTDLQVRAEALRCAATYMASGPYGWNDVVDCSHVFEKYLRGGLGCP